MKFRIIKSRRFGLQIRRRRNVYQTWKRRVWIAFIPRLDAGVCWVGLGIEYPCKAPSKAPRGYQRLEDTPGSVTINKTKGG